MNFKDVKHELFDSRITVHPSIANAYCMLTLTHAIMVEIENGKAITTPDGNGASKTQGEQALMKEFFLDLMNLETQDINKYLSKYYHLKFVQTLISRADFQAIQATNDTDAKQTHYKTLSSWLIENLNNMGLRYTTVPTGINQQSPIIVQNSHALAVLKTGMDTLLKVGNDRSLLNSPSRFWVALELVVGLFLVSITLSAMSHIVQGKGILLLLAGAYGAYLAYNSINVIRVPAFEPNLSSMPKPTDNETIVINKDHIDVEPKSKASSSYGTFWKKPEEPKPPSMLEQAKLKFRELTS